LTLHFDIKLGIFVLSAFKAFKALYYI